MIKHEVVLPAMGEGVIEATIIKWLKKEGDIVELDESIVEIATDKVDSEVPAPIAGKLKKQLVKENTVAKINQAIALIEPLENGEEIKKKENTDTSNYPKDFSLSERSHSIAENLGEKATAHPMKTRQTEDNNSSKKRHDFYSPLVRVISKREGISTEILKNIKGSGKDGRITKDDLMNYLQNPQHFINPQSNLETKTIQSFVNNNEVIEMDRVRKLIAEHMILSKQTSAHVYSFVEADVTRLVAWRLSNKSKFEKKYGEKITFTPLFAWAIIKAIEEFPMINVSVEGTKIIKKKDVNIGIATALPNGNLVVPVIKQAHTYSIIELAKKVNDLANRARQNKLNPSEVQGGTYTLTNIGTFGNLFGTPIINQPQVAIMAVGVIKKKPIVLEQAQSDVIAIRSMMYLSHAYDHRVVDGALGGMFVKRVAEYLENFDLDILN